MPLCYAVMVGIEQLSWLHLLICYLIHTIEHSLDFRYIFMLETLALIGSLKIFFSDVSAKMFLNNLVWKAMWELFCCMHRFFVALLVYFFPILILLSQNQVLALIFFFFAYFLFSSWVAVPFLFVLSIWDGNMDIICLALQLCTQCDAWCDS